MTQPSNVERLRAMRAARFAAEHRLPATVCPFDPYGADPVARVLALVWVREYLRRKPVPPSVIDHGDRG